MIIGKLEWHDTFLPGRYTSCSPVETQLLVCLQCGFDDTCRQLKEGDNCPVCELLAKNPDPDTSEAAA